MANKIELVKFSAAGGVQCHYAGVNAAYGNLDKAKKSTLRKINPGFLALFSACIREISWMTFPYMGELWAMVSGGAYVPKAGWHGKGEAYDLGGLHWRTYVGHMPQRLSLIDLARQYHKKKNNVELDYLDNYLLYLAIEAVIRKHFGTVLGIHHNRQHWNHWHIDPGTKVGYWDKGFGSNTRITFVQAVLRATGFPIKIDGDAGPKTKDAIKAARVYYGLEKPLTNKTMWLQFLTLAAMDMLQRREALV